MASAKEYYIGGKAITGERDGIIYSIVRANYDDETFVLVKDEDFSGRFDENLRLDEQLKAELRARYSKLNHILYLCDNRGCTGFIANKEDFDKVNLGIFIGSFWRIERDLHLVPDIFLPFCRSDSFPIHVVAIPNQKQTYKTYSSLFSLRITTKIHQFRLCCPVQAF